MECYICYIMFFVALHFIMILLGKYILVEKKCFFIIFKYVIIHLFYFLIFEIIFEILFKLALYCLVDISGLARRMLC